MLEHDDKDDYEARQKRNKYILEMLKEMSELRII